jgi:hypothetical protein
MVLNKEVESLWNYISRSVARIILCLDGLNEGDLNWKPLDNANSLYVLAIHMMGNVDSNLLGVLCHQNIIRQRENEFSAYGTSSDSVQQKWREIQERITSYLTQLPPNILDQELVHPRRGKITGRDLMITIARHAAEHVGHAELTRDLLFTARGRALPPREF